MRISALFGASQATETSLTLLDVKEENVREIELAPMKIKVFQLQWRSQSNFETIFGVSLNLFSKKKIYNLKILLQFTLVCSVVQWFLIDLCPWWVFFFISVHKLCKIFCKYTLIQTLKVQQISEEIGILQKSFSFF